MVTQIYMQHMESGKCLEIFWHHRTTSGSAIWRSTCLLRHSVVTQSGQAVMGQMSCMSPSGQKANLSGFTPSSQSRQTRHFLRLLPTCAYGDESNKISMISDAPAKFLPLIVFQSIICLEYFKRNFGVDFRETVG